MVTRLGMDDDPSAMMSTDGWLSASNIHSAHAHGGQTRHRSMTRSLTWQRSLPIQSSHPPPRQLRQDSASPGRTRACNSTGCPQPTAGQPSRTTRHSRARTGPPGTRSRMQPPRRSPRRLPGLPTALRIKSGPALVKRAGTGPWATLTGIVASIPGGYTSIYTFKRADSTNSLGTTSAPHGPSIRGII